MLPEVTQILEKSGSSIQRPLVQFRTNLRRSSPEETPNGPYLGYTRLKEDWNEDDGLWDNAKKPSGPVNTPLSISPAANAIDSARLGAMLTGIGKNVDTSGSWYGNAFRGVNFETHQLENAALSAKIRNYWIEKHKINKQSTGLGGEYEPTGGNTLLDNLGNLVKNITGIDGLSFSMDTADGLPRPTINLSQGSVSLEETTGAARATAAVLEQAAVAGTGEHFEPYSYRAKLGKNYSPSVVAAEGRPINLLNYAGTGTDKTTSKIKDDIRKISKLVETAGPDVLSSKLSEIVPKESERGRDRDKKTDWIREFNQVPFEIVSITPEDKKYLYFQANLETFDDTYTGNWDTQQYVGRAEPFFTYTGFSRDISFSFKVAAVSRNDLLPIYNKLNMLVSTTAPSYDENGSFMRGTLVSVTIGDFLRNQKGIFKSVKLSWKSEYPWAVGHDTRDDYEEEDLIVPHVLDVSVSFTPIHDFVVDARPQTGVLQKRYLGRKEFGASAPDMLLPKLEVLSNPSIVL